MMKRVVIILAMVLQAIGLGQSIEIPVFDGESQISFEPLFDAPAVGELWQGDTLRILLIFDSPPDANWWSYKVHDGEDFDYFYQKAPANAQTILKGGVEYLKWYDPNWHDWPERQSLWDGSYAVYHKYKRDHARGQANYRNGKAFHIIADAWDLQGNHSKPLLSIKGGIYTVSMDRHWLDSAEYPVVINDSFGWASSGASFAASVANYQYVSGPYSPSSDGDATDCNMWCYVDAKNWTMGIFADSSGPTTLLKDTDGEATTQAGIKQYTDSLDSSLSVSSGSSYWIGWNSNAVGYSYDDGTGVDMWYEAKSYNSGTLVDFTSPTEFAGRRVGLYITYTPSGGAAAGSGDARGRGLGIGIGKGIGW